GCPNSWVGRAVPKPAQPEPKGKAILLLLVLLLVLDLLLRSFRLRGQFAALAQKICAKMTGFRLYVSSAPLRLADTVKFRRFWKGHGALETCLRADASARQAAGPAFCVSFGARLSQPQRPRH